MSGISFNDVWILSICLTLGLACSVRVYALHVLEVVMLVIRLQARDWWQHVGRTLKLRE